MIRRLLAVAVAASCGLAAAAASAGGPINSSDQTTSSSGAADAHGKTHVNVVPVAGGDTDIGVGVGEFTGITRVQQGVDPYVWDLQSGGLVTFKKPSDSGLLVPFQDFWVKLDVPRPFGSASDLTVRPSYTREATLGYYGLGNASTDAVPAGSSMAHFWYARTHPSLLATLRWRLRDHLAGLLETRYTQNWLQVPPGSKLAADLASPDPEVRKLLGSTAAHGVALFSYGVEWDDRDSQVSPHRGSLLSAIARLAPGGDAAFPFRYGQANADARVYVPAGDHVVLALRGVADVLFGDPPLYELARFDDTYAIGGSKGVRGVPAQRYSGKVKVFGNAEVRVDVATFDALGKHLLLGVVGFFDAGRLWADTTPQPALDGTGLGLKYGTGGGLRLKSGSTFVLRGDLAWSPDARPVGGYFEVGQLF